MRLLVDMPDGLINHEGPCVPVDELRRALCSYVAKSGNVVVLIRDPGERRCGRERRQFSYTAHLPERRNGDDRRGATIRENGGGNPQRCPQPEEGGTYEDASP
jgi:hypothetical protein